MMHPIKPGLDGYPKYLHHQTEAPKLVHSSKEHADVLATDKRWNDKYIYQEFPKCMYHKSGATKDVKDIKEQRALGNDWREKPYDDEVTAAETKNLAAENDALRAELEALRAAHRKV